MPSDVAQSKPTTRGFAWDRVTVKVSKVVPVAGSSTLTSDTETAASSSRIVSTPFSPITASPDGVGLDRLTGTVSSSSVAMSPTIGTTALRLATPGAKLSVPPAAL